ncbi:hypothetical protein Nepgr_029122 [Nepenthes gracilis]|uniref:Uncharacterized protein n=1 Tax=Nepenthes gracilis TaxID=150966 RepID=A0AAD3TDI2_NEPGR|nr:hypothetical protein Nepgr_029122 [Nepenthes gracilis]
MNEPNLSTWNGYAQGTFAPGRCSNYIGNCSAGNSGTEPYIVGHNLLLSHAAVVHLYRHKYKRFQHGIIGMALATTWVLPINGSSASRRAASRSLDFSIGWFMDPITSGDYPKSMRAIVGKRLPKFERKQSHLLKDSFDFIGLNYYTTYYAYNTPTTGNKLSYTTDSQSTLTRVGDLSSEPIKKSLNDTWRIDYLRGHLFYLHESIQGGGNVQGYFVWSFLDDFEWNSGYTVRFGLTLIDYNNGLKRYPKRSALWFKGFLTK